MALRLDLWKVILFKVGQHDSTPPPFPFPIPPAFILGEKLIQYLFN